MTEFSYITGGTLAPDALSYVERKADRDLFASLKAGETCYVLNSRQMGKSSLCVRTIVRLKEAGIRTAFCDLTKFGGRNLTAEQWYVALLSEIGRELGLRNEFLAHWKDNASLPPVQRLFGCLTEVALLGDSPVVVFIDEIDVTLSLPFSADEFFAAIRQCYVGRATDEKLKRLSFCLLGTATPADLIQDTRVSPFNIGKRIELGDFTEAEALPLASGLGNQNLLNRVLYWTGGHPYLTQRLCQAAQASGAKSPAEVDKVCSDLFLTHAAKDSDDNLAFVRNRLLKSEAELPALLDLYRQMRSGKAVRDDETNPLCSILKLSGVARVEGGLLKVRNRIYEHVFDRTWVETHMPDAEVRRQNEAYRRGAFRVLAISSVALVVVGTLAAVAFFSARRVEALSAENLKNLYIAKMNVIQGDYQEGSFAQIIQLLRETQSSPYRGWEWAYWESVVHPKSLLLTFAKHSGALNTIAFSPNGQQLATGSTDGTAKILDSTSGRVLHTLSGHADTVTDVAFSPNGSLIATASNDNTAKVWECSTGKQLMTLHGHSDYLNGIAFSPDGGRIATSSADKTAKVWDVNNGALVLTLRGTGSPLDRVIFSPDGKKVAAAFYDGTIQIWDAQSGKKGLTIHGHNSRVCGLAYSPKSDRLVTASQDGTASLWDAKSGTAIWTVIEKTGGLNSIAISPDGKFVATGSNSGATNIWETSRGRQVLSLIGHTGYITRVTFSPDGRRIATSSWDGTARVWDLMVAIRNLNVVRLTGQVNSVAYSNDGKYIATAESDNLAKIWDRSLLREAQTLKGHQSLVNCIAFSPDGKIVATASYDKTAKLWETETGREVRTLSGHLDRLVFLVFSPDGKFIATASRDKSAKIWEVSTGREILALKGHLGGVDTVAFSPDGKRIATGSADNTAKIWDVKTGRELVSLNGHSKYGSQTTNWRMGVVSVCFSPDGKTIATGSVDRTAKLWNATDGRELVTLKGHKDYILSVAFSPDGKRLATSSFDQTAKLWDCATGSDVLTLKGHSDGINQITFSPDGTQLATASDDGTFRFWDTATPAQGERSDREDARGSK